MTTHEPIEHPDVTPPILTFGPPGSHYLAVEPTPDAARSHLHDDYASPELADGLPPMHELQHFDSRGRALRLDGDPESPVLATGDRDVSREELHVRVEEIFARVRTWADGQPSVFATTDAEVDHADLVRPPALPAAPSGAPTDDAYDAFFDALLEQLRTNHLRSDRTREDRGSWWHNLFHH